jgi:formylglycine-generating enzyme required for sulfatase activity
MTCASKGAQLGLSKYIERALDRLVDCRELDLLIFGFWGHGFAPSGRRYLCGLDTCEDDLDRTSVSLDVVSGKLDQVQSENTLLILDCCQNRPAGRSAVTEPMSKGEEASFSEMARDIQAVRQSQFRSSTPTVAIWNACRDGQKAYEWVDKGHGIFTAYLLEAFEKGYRNVAGMASWTTDRVAKKAGDLYGQRQNPFIKIEGKGDIRLFQGPMSRLEDDQDATSVLGKVMVRAKPRLKIESVPNGARISVNERSAGAAPLDLSLMRGDYGIRAEKEGYETWDEVVSFDGAGDTTLHIELKEKPIIYGQNKKMTSKDYERLLDKYQFSAQEITLGKILRGRVIKITSSHVLVDIGLKSEGIIPLEEFVGAAEYSKPKVGDEVNAVLKNIDRKEGYFILSRRIAADQEALRLLGKANTKQHVTSRIIHNEEEKLTLKDSNHLLDKYQFGYKEIAPKKIEAFFPMTSEEAAAVQRNAAEALGVPLKREVDLGKSINIKMILIPPGKFMMGSPNKEPGRLAFEGPQHEVAISRPFYLSVYKLTQGEWKAVMENNPSVFKKGDNYPVESVRWDDVQRFIISLNARTGQIFRLPTEAEWEYACRAGKKEARYGKIDEIAWYDRNSGGETHPVGKLFPNSFGLYDMLGNVGEWCQDWYRVYQSTSDVNPMGPPSGDCRVFRGGSFKYRARDARASSRFMVLPSFWARLVGFRLAKDL